mmetsp:Transcript_49230/g.141500  ORF Transcript_49230/g.141500 Transcript_49230/m.141500 type:complete len:692 (-) Transcript_49230:97-2172(-)
MGARNPANNRSCASPAVHPVRAVDTGLRRGGEDRALQLLEVGDAEARHRVPTRAGVVAAAAWSIEGSAPVVALGNVCEDRLGALLIQHRVEEADRGLALRDELGVDQRDHAGEGRRRGARPVHGEPALADDNRIAVRGQSDIGNATARLLVSGVLVVGLRVLGRVSAARSDQRADAALVHVPRVVGGARNLLLSDLSPHSTTDGGHPRRARWPACLQADGLDGPALLPVQLLLREEARRAIVARCHHNGHAAQGELHHHCLEERQGPLRDRELRHAVRNRDHMRHRVGVQETREEVVEERGHALRVGLGHVPVADLRPRRDAHHVLHVEVGLHAVPGILPARAIARLRVALQLARDLLHVIVVGNAHGPLEVRAVARAPELPQGCVHDLPRRPLLLGAAAAPRRGRWHTVALLQDLRRDDAALGLAELLEAAKAELAALGLHAGQIRALGDVRATHQCLIVQCVQDRLHVPTQVVWQLILARTEDALVALLMRVLVELRTQQRLPSRDRRPRGHHLPLVAHMHHRNILVLIKQRSDLPGGILVAEAVLDLRAGEPLPVRGGVGIGAVLRHASKLLHVRVTHHETELVKLRAVAPPLLHPTERVLRHGLIPRAGTSGLTPRGRASHLQCVQAACAFVGAGDAALVARSEGGRDLIGRRRLGRRRPRSMHVGQRREQQRCMARSRRRHGSVGA